MEGMTHGGIFFSLLIICSYFLFSNSRGTLWNKVEKKKNDTKWYFHHKFAAGVPKSPTSSPQFPQVQSQRCYLFQLYITPRCSNTPLSHGVTITITQQLLWLRQTLRSRIQYRKHCLIGAAALWQPHSESFPLQTATFSPIPRILRAGARCLKKKKKWQACASFSHLL